MIENVAKLDNPFRADSVMNGYMVNQFIRMISSINCRLDLRLLLQNLRE